MATDSASFFSSCDTLREVLHVVERSDDREGPLWKGENAFRKGTASSHIIIKVRANKNFMLNIAQRLTTVDLNNFNQSKQGANK
mmetsp:Transcript_32077/g.47197  ORF Transcript_32077/g.47197 Transcript_32077/m.47197 type:complete len:84 (-) Transcript_32077:16-267(-)